MDINVTSIGRALIGGFTLSSSPEKKDEPPHVLTTVEETGEELLDASGWLQRHHARLHRNQGNNGLYNGTMASSSSPRQVLSRTGLCSDSLFHGETTRPRLTITC